MATYPDLKSITLPIEQNGILQSQLRQYSASGTVSLSVSYLVCNKKLELCMQLPFRSRMLLRASMLSHIYKCDMHAKVRAFTPLFYNCTIEEC